MLFSANRYSLPRINAPLRTSKGQSRPTVLCQSFIYKSGATSSEGADCQGLLTFLAGSDGITKTGESQI